jgi:hypothetical protein
VGEGGLMRGGKKVRRRNLEGIRRRGKDGKGEKGN